MNINNNTQTFDAIVVGGGISGLLTALILGKHGHQVILFEKEKEVGGNCRSYGVDGFTVDTGPHAITALKDGGPLTYIMDGYFDFVPTFKPYGDYYIRSVSGEITRCPTNVSDFLKFKFLPRKDRLILSSKIASVILKSSAGVDYSDVSIYDALPKTLSNKTYAMADTFSYFMSGRDMKETSVQRMLNGASFTTESGDTGEKFEKFMTGEIKSKTDVKSSSPNPKMAVSHDGGFSKQGYPLGGIGSIVDSILKSLPENVVIKTGCRVTDIITENGKVIGIECVRSDTPISPKSIYFSDFIVFTGFARNLKRMIKEELPESYIKTLDGIDHTISLTTWIGLDECVPEFDYMGSEVHFEKIPSWGGSTSNYDPSLAPPGQQLVCFGFAPVPRKRIRQNIKKSYDALFEMLPGIEKHVIMKHEQITVPEKAAITLNGTFADIKTPIQGLYMAGTDTDRRSMGITRASYSVINLIHELQKDGYFKHKNSFKGNNIKRNYLPLTNETN